MKGSYALGLLAGVILLTACGGRTGGVRTPSPAMIIDSQYIEITVE